MLHTSIPAAPANLAKLAKQARAGCFTKLFVCLPKAQAYQTDTNLIAIAQSTSLTADNVGIDYLES